MAEETKDTKGAQTGAPSTSTPGEVKLVKHIVTELDLQYNPDLVAKGITVGSEVEIPEEAKAKADARELKAKEDADKKAKSDADAKAKDNKKPKKYTVVSPFADRDNFGKKWVEGDDVSHFEQARLDLCVERGLVKKG